MKLRILILACLALLIFGTSAFAAPVTAQTYSNYVQGNGVSTERDDPTRALGDKTGNGSNGDTDFVSLGRGTYDSSQALGDDYTGNGYGGSLDFGFGTDVTFTGWATIYETTYNARSGWKEYASVLGSLDGTTWTLLGNIDNQGTDGGSTVYFEGTYAFLKIIDATALNGGAGGDGFDVDAVVVNATPIPGAAWLLGTGLLGLLGLKRRFSF